MKMIRLILLLLSPCLLLTLRAGGADVLTYRNDNGRTGVTLDETGLSPSTVNANQLVNLFNLQVDGQVYAQPLYVPSMCWR